MANGFDGDSAQQRADSGDAEAIIRLAQHLCSGLNLQPDGLRSRVHADAEVRPAFAARAQVPASEHAHEQPTAPPPAGGASALIQKQGAVHQHAAAPATRTSAIDMSMPFTAPPPGSVAPAAGDELDSLDVLIAAEQQGPPSLQCLAAQALLPPQLPDLFPTLSPGTCSQPVANGVGGSPRHSPEQPVKLLDTMRSLTDCSTSSLQCDVCSGTWPGSSAVARPGSSSNSSDCSICAARQRTAAAAMASATVQTSQPASPARQSPSQQPVQRTTTADCWAQTSTMADAAVGRSRPGTASGTRNRERKPAAVLGGKRRCVPADGSTADSKEQKSSADDGAAAAAAAPTAAELPWAEQLRRTEVHRQQKRPLRRRAPGRAGVAQTDAAEGAVRPEAAADAATEQQQQTGYQTDNDLSRRMAALEAKVASWSIPQASHFLDAAV